MKKEGVNYPIIEELGELKLVGYRVVCEGHQYINEIPKAANLLKDRMKGIDQIIDPSVQYGAFVVDSYSDDEDGYWICVQVKEYNRIPKDMITLTVPPQQYAVKKHIGANTEIRDVYTSLHSWIEANGYVRQLDKWHLERYLNWDDSGNLTIELMDTVRKA